MLKACGALFRSRKFLVALATVAGVGFCAAGGGVGAVVIAVAEIAGIVGPVLITTIAAEDCAEKWGNGKGGSE